MKSLIVLAVCFYVAAATPISYNKAPVAVQTHAAPAYKAPAEKKAPVMSTYKAPAAPAYKARVAPSKASIAPVYKAPVVNTYKAPAAHAAPLRKYKRSVLTHKTPLSTAYKTPAAYKVKSPAYLPHRTPIVVLY